MSKAPTKIFKWTCQFFFLFFAGTKYIKWNHWQKLVTYNNLLKNLLSLEIKKNQSGRISRLVDWWYLHSCIYYLLCNMLFNSTYWNVHKKITIPYAKWIVIYEFFNKKLWIVSLNLKWCYSWVRIKEWR